MIWRCLQFLKMIITFFSGASLSKAQSEFATGVMKNDAVRQAAADAAREGVRSQFANAGGQAENRY